MKNLLIISTLFLLPLSLQAKITEIFETKTQKTLTVTELVKTTPATGHFVFGEFHNTKEIQNAQARIMQAKVFHERAIAEYTLHWEFLDYTDQTKIDQEFQKLLHLQIDAKTFLTNTAGAQNLAYTPLIEALQFTLGRIKGINLPRAIKQKAIAQGIESIDPKYVPDSHYIGGPEYSERFTAVMGGHVPANKLPRYFMAQCLTDSVMAEQIALDEMNNGLNFVVAGSFHTDFYDATVVRLKKLVTNEVVTFKFISKKTSSTSDIEEYKSEHPKYGNYADYIIVTE